MTVTELSIKRPSLIVAAFTLLGLLGTWGYRSLQYELLPKITPPVVTISTVYPGASPEEVETGVSRVIEDAVSGLEKVDSIRTTSREGFSMVVVEFLQTANIDTSLQDVQRKVNQAQGDLPDDAERPVLSKLALDEIPVLRVGVSGENIDPRSLYQLTDDQVRPRLSKVPGVGQISLTGGDRREIQINLDASKLRAYRLSAPQVLAALRAGNLELPAGRIEPGSGQYVVRLAGKVDSVRAIGDIIVSRSAGGGEVRISDVAEVHDGVSDPDNITRVNGRDSIGLVVSKQTDANAVEVSRLVREQLTALEKTYADKGVTFFVAQDTSTFTVDAASAVKVDLSLAIFLVALVMLLFLHSLRSSLIVMVAIPASLVSTFFVMYVAGFSLNLMTLLALSLVVGILVDDSIVVLENIFRRLELGDAPRDAALRGRNEIGFTALAITLVDIAVFVPMAMVTGTTGAIVRPFAVVVAVSTLFSLIVSFTITPALASRFTRIEHLNPHTLYGRFSLAFERGYERLTGQYTSLLRWSLQHRWVIGLIALSLFFASAQLGRLGLIGQEFVAVSDRGEFTVFLELPPGARLENTNAAALQVEQLLFSMPEVDRVFTDVGASGEGLIGLSSPDEAQLNVALVPKEKRVKTTAEIEQEIKHRVSGIPGIKVRVNPIGLFGTANETPVQLSVVGPARAAVTQTGDLLVQAAQTVPGTEDVRLSSEDGKPELRLNIDRNRMAALGLTVADVAATLRTALEGDDSVKYTEGSNRYDIRVKFDELDRTRVADLPFLTVLNRSGELVEIGQFAQIEQQSGPSVLQRKDRNPSVTFYSQAVGRPGGTVGDEIMAAVQQGQAVPNGVTIIPEGELKRGKESQSALGVVFLAATLFIYLIMVALYDSYIYPLVVLFSIPLAVIGALFALALTLKSMSIFAIMGMIMLIGLVAKNAILLVDFTNRLREEGHPTFEALVEAGRARLRPILMTTLTMIIGMLPIAMSHSAGSEWKTALGWVLIGGLTSSMLLTLVVVPVVYSALDGGLKRLRRWRAPAAADGSSPKEAHLPVAAARVAMISHPTRD